MDVNLIKTGDVLLVRGKSWLSKAILKFTKMNYSHAGIFWWSYDELMIIEEDRTGYGNAGLIVTPFSKYLSSGKKLMIRRPNFKTDGSLYGKFMISYLGKIKYSYWDLIIAQPIYQLTNKKIWIGGKTLKDGKTVCSGWCYYVYNHFTNLYKTWFKKTPGEFETDTNFFTLFKN